MANSRLQAASDNNMGSIAYNGVCHSMLGIYTGYLESDQHGTIMQSYIRYITQYPSLCLCKVPIAAVYIDSKTKLLWKYYT